jgi:Phage tail assembly chaperone proteins, E, or 41 or 14
LTTIKLQTPVEAYGEKVHEITLREPTGKDIRKAGVPFRSWQDENGTTYNGADPQAVATLVALMGNIPPSAVDQLSAPDWLACMEGVTSYFNRADGQAESTTATGMSSGSSAPIRMAS